MSEKLGIVEIMRVSKSGGRFYLSITKLAKTLDLKQGDQLKVEIKEKVVTTYRD